MAVARNLATRCTNREVGSVGSEEDYAALLIAAIYGKAVGMLHAHDVAAPSFLLKGEVPTKSSDSFSR